jgi:hypothetical protein
MMSQKGSEGLGLFVFQKLTVDNDNRNALKPRNYSAGAEVEGCCGWLAVLRAARVANCQEVQKTFGSPAFYA